MAGRRILSAREQHEMLSPWRAAAAPRRHPDLDEALRRHGVVHTTGGRRLPAGRYAVADPRTQETRLADPVGWQRHQSFTPSGLAVQGARAYTSLRGLPDPHQVSYANVMQTPQTVRTVGRLYDRLPDFDRSAVPAFEAMRREVNHQHDFMTNRLGIKTQTVDHDPYADVHEMMDDINHRKTLKVLGTHVTGGHPYFSDADNDKFRAVHDFFGHAATGRSFDRHGEQASYLAHAQMFSPQAAPALTSETKGQNSSLILNGHFGPQKVALLPPEHWSGSAVDLSRLPRVAAAPERRIGININDTHQDYTGQILRGEKTVETRDTHSLKRAVGNRVGLVRTHDRRPNLLVGWATVGEPKLYTSEADFDADYDLHRVGRDSRHHIRHSPTGMKFGYPLHDVEPEPDPYHVDIHGIPWRYLDASRTAAPRRRFNQEWQIIGGDYFPVDVISHYMQRKETGFGDEKSPLYERNGQPPLSQQIDQGGYEKPVELCTDGKSGSVYDGHHRIDIARQLGHTHVPVQVTWRVPDPVWGPEGAYGNKIEPWLKKWLTDMRGGRETVGRRRNHHEF